MPNAKVTIGIPAFNRPEGLKRAILSVLDQSYKDFIIIVSDDASPLCNMATQMQMDGISDERIKYIRQKENIGSESNFKFVLSQSSTEYFAWLADDDSIESDFLLKLVSVLDGDDSIVLAMCDVNCIRIKTGEQWTEQLTTLRSNLDWSVARDMLFSDLKLNTFYCLYGLYKSSVLKKIRFRVDSQWKKFNSGWEEPFLAAVATNGRIVSIDAVLKTYYFNEGSVYHKEVDRMTAFDKVVLHFDLIFRLSNAALRSSLPLSDRVRLALFPWRVNLHRFSRKIARKLQK